MIYWVTKGSPETQVPKLHTVNGLLVDTRDSEIPRIQTPLLSPQKNLLPRYPPTQATFWRQQRPDTSYPTGEAGGQEGAMEN